MEQELPIANCLNSLSLIGKILYSLGCNSPNNFSACYKTTDYRRTDAPITNHRPTDKCSTDPMTTDNRPPTHRQVLHRPTDHQPLTHQKVLHRPTDHQFTDSPTLLQLTNNPLTHQSYFNRVTIGPVLSITKFSSSFGMGIICYCIRKIIYKMTDKK